MKAAFAIIATMLVAFSAVVSAAPPAGSPVVETIPGEFDLPQKDRPTI